MDVVEWLRTLWLAQYAPAFRQNNIAGDLIADLTADDFNDLRVVWAGSAVRCTQISRA